MGGPHPPQYQPPQETVSHLIKGLLTNSVTLFGWPYQGWLLGVDPKSLGPNIWHSAIRWMEIHDWRNWKKEATTFFLFFRWFVSNQPRCVVVCVCVCLIVWWPHIPSFLPFANVFQIKDSKHVKQHDGFFPLFFFTTSHCRIETPYVGWNLFHFHLMQKFQCTAPMTCCFTCTLQFQRKKKRRGKTGDSWKLAGRMCEPTKICSQKVGIVYWWFTRVRNLQKITN